MWWNESFASEPNFQRSNARHSDMLVFIFLDGLVLSTLDQSLVVVVVGHSYLVTDVLEIRIAMSVWGIPKWKSPLCILFVLLWASHSFVAPCKCILWSTLIWRSWLYPSRVSRIFYWHPHRCERFKRSPFKRAALPSIITQDFRAVVCVLFEKFQSETRTCHHVLNGVPSSRSNVTQMKNELSLYYLYTYRTAKRPNNTKTGSNCLYKHKNCRIFVRISRINNKPAPENHQTLSNVRLDFFSILKWIESLVHVI